MVVLPAFASALLQPRCSPPVLSVEADDRGRSIFTSLIANHGVTAAVALEGSAREAGGRRLVSERDVAAGEVLLKVPNEILLTAHRSGVVGGLSGQTDLVWDEVGDLREEVGEVCGRHDSNSWCRHHAADGAGLGVRWLGCTWVRLVGRRLRISRRARLSTHATPASCSSLVARQANFARGVTWDVRLALALFEATAGCGGDFWMGYRELLPAPPLVTHPLCLPLPLLAELGDRDLQATVQVSVRARGHGLHSG